MKQKLCIAAMLCGLLTVSNVQTIEAENASSGAGISFTGENTDPTDPVNPDNPNNPGNKPGTGMGGPISLDYVPEMNFGTHAISGKVESYEMEDLKPFIQVTDKRGTGAGWKVTVSLGNFENADRTKSFPGVIAFKNASVLTTTGNTSNAPIASNISVTSAQTGERIFGTVGPNEGMGTWITRWYPISSPTKNDAITLTINTANITVDSYTADMNWLMSNAP